MSRIVTIVTSAAAGYGLAEVVRRVRNRMWNRKHPGQHPRFPD